MSDHARKAFHQSLVTPEHSGILGSYGMKGAFDVEFRPNKQQRLAIKNAQIISSGSLTIHGIRGSGKSTLVPEIVAEHIVTSRSKGPLALPSLLISPFAEDGIMFFEWFKKNPSTRSRWLPDVPGYPLHYAWMLDRRRQIGLLSALASEEYGRSAVIKWLESFNQWFDLHECKLDKAADILRAKLQANERSIFQLNMIHFAIKSDLHNLTKERLEENQVESFGRAERAAIALQALPDGTTEYERETAQIVAADFGVQSRVAGQRLIVKAQLSDLISQYFPKQEPADILKESREMLRKLACEQLFLSLRLIDFDLVCKLGEIGTAFAPNVRIKDLLRLRKSWVASLFPILLIDGANLSSATTSPRNEQGDVFSLAIVDDADWLDADTAMFVDAFSTKAIVCGDPYSVQGGGKTGVVKTSLYAKMKDRDAWSDFTLRGRRGISFQRSYRHSRRITGILNANEWEQTVGQVEDLRPSLLPPADLISFGNLEIGPTGTINERGLAAWLKIARRTLETFYEQPISECVKIIIPDETKRRGLQSMLYRYLGNGKPSVLTTGGKLPHTKITILFHGAPSDDETAYFLSSTGEALLLTLDPGSGRLGDLIAKFNRKAFSGGYLCCLREYVATAVHDGFISMKDPDHHDAVLYFLLANATDRALVSSLNFQVSPPKRDYSAEWLRKTQLRGVSVYLNIGVRTGADKTATEEQVDRLRKDGITAVIREKKHSKTILVDNIVKVTGSFNWLQAFGNDLAFEEDSTMLFGPTIQEDIGDEWTHYLQAFDSE
jgi:hypothetical protein